MLDYEDYSEDLPEDNHSVKSPIEEDFEFALDKFSYSKKLWSLKIGNAQEVISHASNRLEFAGYVDKNGECQTLIIPENFLDSLNSLERRFYFATKLREHNSYTYGGFTVDSINVASGLAALGGLVKLIHSLTSTIKKNDPFDIESVIELALVSLILFAAAKKTAVHEKYFKYDAKALEAIGIDNLDSGVSCLKKMYKWIDVVSPDDFCRKETFVPPGEHARSYRLLRYAQKMHKQSENYIQL